MKYLLFTFCFLIALVSFAQEEEKDEDLITDRPDETESAALISKNYLQIESGFFYEENEEDFGLEKIWGYNTTLIRYGLLENLEFRLGFDVLNETSNLNGILFDPGTGLSPLLVGAKIGIAEENGILPQMALLGHLFLPFTATEAYRPESTGVDFRFAFAHEFSNSDLSYNLGAKWHDDATHATFLYTIGYGYDLTEEVGLFIELYGDLPENDSAAHHWDGGLTFLIRNNFQLDAFIGSGINNEQRIIYGAGLSYRFPN